MGLRAQARVPSSLPAQISLGGRPHPAGRAGGSIEVVTPFEAARAAGRVVIAWPAGRSRRFGPGPAGLESAATTQKVWCAKVRVTVRAV